MSVDLAALSAAVHGAAVGSRVMVASSTAPSPELLQRLALIKLLVALVARRQQQLRAQGVAAGGRALSPPAPTVTQRDLAVEKISTAVTRARDAAITGQLGDVVQGSADKVAGAALAGLVSGGIEGGFDAASTALSSLAAAAPVAVPLAVGGIITSIVLPSILSGEFFSNKIDPAVDYSTPEGYARAARQALLIKQDLADTRTATAAGQKFARKGGVRDISTEIFGG